MVKPDQGAVAVGCASGVLSRKSITGIVPPLLMTHLLFWLSAWAISTWMYCSPRVPLPSSSCEDRLQRLFLRLCQPGDLVSLSIRFLLRSIEFAVCQGPLLYGLSRCLFLKLHGHHPVFDRRDHLYRG